MLIDFDKVVGGQTGDRKLSDDEKNRPLLELNAQGRLVESNDKTGVTLLKSGTDKVEAVLQDVTFNLICLGDMLLPMLKIIRDFPDIQTKIDFLNTLRVRAFDTCLYDEAVAEVCCAIGDVQGLSAALRVWSLKSKKPEVTQREPMLPVHWQDRFFNAPRLYDRYYQLLSKHLDTDDLSGLLESIQLSHDHQAQLVRPTFSRDRSGSSVRQSEQGFTVSLSYFQGQFASFAELQYQLTQDSREPWPWLPESFLSALLVAPEKSSGIAFLKQLIHYHVSIIQESGQASDQSDSFLTLTRYVTYLNQACQASSSKKKKYSGSDGLLLDDLLSFSFEFLNLPGSLGVKLLDYLGEFKVSEKIQSKQCENYKLFLTVKKELLDLTGKKAKDYSEDRQRAFSEKITQCLGKVLDEKFRALIAAPLLEYCLFDRLLPKRAYDPNKVRAMTQLLFRLWDKSPPELRAEHKLHCQVDLFLNHGYVDYLNDLRDFYKAEFDAKHITFLNHSSIQKAFDNMSNDLVGESGRNKLISFIFAITNGRSLSLGELRVFPELLAKFKKESNTSLQNDTLSSLFGIFSEAMGKRELGIIQVFKDKRKLDEAEKLAAKRKAEEKAKAAEEKKEADRVIAALASQYGGPGQAIAPPPPPRRSTVSAPTDLFAAAGASSSGAFTAASVDGASPTSPRPGSSSGGNDGGQ